MLSIVMNLGKLEIRKSSIFFYADFHRFRDVRRAYTFRSIRKKQRPAPKPKVSTPSIPQYKEWRFRIRNGELVPNFTVHLFRPRKCNVRLLYSPQEVAT